MIDLSLETLAYIIAKAREFDAEVAPVDDASGSNPSDDSVCDILEDSPENPTRQELAEAVQSLNDGQKIELLALMWLGRGDYGKEEWPAALREARRVHDKREAEYLIGTPLLADYLEEGLSQLGYSTEEFAVGRL